MPVSTVPVDRAEGNYLHRGCQYPARVGDMANCVENMVKSTVSCIFPISFSGGPLGKRGTSCAWWGYFIGKHFKFKTVLSHCDLAYSFDRFRDYSDQLGLEPRTSNEGCPGRCSSHLKLKTHDFQLRPYSISKNSSMVPGLEPGKSHTVGTTFTSPSNSYSFLYL